MAGVMNEYDEATPLKSSYCARRLTEEEYEEETSDYTQKCLEQLMQYLDENPGDYERVVKKRKKEEAENSGIFSYVKVCNVGHFVGVVS